MRHWLKIFSSVILMIFLLRMIPLDNLIVIFQKMKISWVISAVILIFGIQFIFAFRLLRIIIGLHHYVTFERCFKLSLISHGMSQVLPSSYGGDLVKALYLASHLGIKNSAHSMIIDRLSGLLLLLTKAAIFLPFYAYYIPHKLLFVFDMAILLTLVILVSFVFIDWGSFIKRDNLLKPIVELSEASRKSLSGVNGAYVMFLSFLIHVNGILLYYTLALSLGVNVSFFSFWLLVPMIYIISLFPFAMAGWGVREVGAVWLFGLAGIPADQALGISLLFGIIMLLGAVPGLIMVGFVKISQKR